MKFKFKEIKKSYIEIKLLLEESSLSKVTNLNDKNAEDSSLWGDNNLDLLNFKYSKHFESEGEKFYKLR